jgi:hypothetical protein
MCRTCWTRGLIVYALTGRCPTYEEYVHQWAKYGTQNVVNRDNMIVELQCIQDGISIKDYRLNKWISMYQRKVTPESDRTKFIEKMTKCVDEHYDVLYKMKDVLHELLARRQIRCECGICKVNSIETEYKEIMRILRIEY